MRPRGRLVYWARVPPVDPKHISPEPLEGRLKFETLISDLSSGFVNLPPAEVDSAIEDAQRRVCEFLGADRSVLWQRSIATPSVFTPTHLYVTQVFPALQRVKKEPGERIELVSDTIIEEVLQDICMLDFGQGLKAKTNVAIWRTRGEHRPLIGEFAFQVRFKDRKELALEAMQRMEAFFVSLQHAAKDWITLNATKTGVVYRLHGNPPSAHE